MARKKTDAVDTKPELDEHGVPQKVAIRRRTPMDWMSLIDNAAKDHWRKLRITIQLREWLMAGKPVRLDVGEAMMAARAKQLGVDHLEHIEVVNINDPNAVAGELKLAKDDGKCEFDRREGKKGIYMKTNNIKAGLKENWSVLGYRNDHRGSRGALAEGVFVYSVQGPDTDPAERDWLYLGEKEDGTHTAVSHTTGPSGPVSSIKRHEYLIRPKIVFEVAIATAIHKKLPDEAFADTLLHFGEHGLGACRSQGYGRFDVIHVEEVGFSETLPAGIKEHQKEEGVATQTS